MHYSRFDSRLLSDLVDMDQMKSERYMRVMGQLDVEFEPDTEISKLLINENTIR